MNYKSSNQYHKQLGIINEIHAVYQIIIHNETMICTYGKEVNGLSKHNTKQNMLNELS